MLWASQITTKSLKSPWIYKQFLKILKMGFIFWTMNSNRMSIWSGIMQCCSIHLDLKYIKWHKKWNKSLRDSKDFQMNNYFKKEIDPNILEKQKPNKKDLWLFKSRKDFLKILKNWIRIIFGVFGRLLSLIKRIIVTSPWNSILLI